MRSRAAVAAALALLGASCQATPATAPTPQPTIRPASGAIRCGGGDHGLDEVQLGWGFCYPATWRYREQMQVSPSPRGVDTTFDIVVAAPTPGRDQGLFAFMIIGTYERGSSANLRDWAAANLATSRPDITLTAISWGNAGEAALIEGTHQRLALTQHHVVLMDVHEGEGNLDLDTEMAQRLGTWRFDY